MESLLALVHSTSSLSGDALNPLIMRALCLPNLYFFGELLEVPRVAAHVQARRCRETCLLGLFCSGTLADYRAQPAMYGELEDPLMEKLKLLTLASLTASEKRVPYARLREALELASDAEVESLVIQAVYTGLVEGQLDQRERCVHVRGSAGRDVLPSELPALAEALGAVQGSVQAAIAVAEAELAEAVAAAEAEAAHKLDYVAKAKAAAAASVAREHGEGNEGARVLLAGGTGAFSLLSTACYALLPFFTTAEARDLRLVCREFHGTVKDFPWMDTETEIWDLGLWRACFPSAKAAKITSAGEHSDPDFDHLVGVHTLDMTGCSQATITDAAFTRLTGIHTLYMSDCCQVTITDAAFAYLRGIKVLSIHGCNQVTDAAFAHLRGIRWLDMCYCQQATITDAAFAHMHGIHKLYMTACYQNTISDTAIAHLAGIHTLDLSHCYQLRGTSIARLRGARVIYTDGCRATLQDAVHQVLAGSNLLH